VKKSGYQLDREIAEALVEAKRRPPSAADKVDVLRVRLPRALGSAIARTQHVLFVATKSTPTGYIFESSDGGTIRALWHKLSNLYLASPERRGWPGNRARGREEARRATTEHRCLVAGGIGGMTPFKICDRDTLPAPEERHPWVGSRYGTDCTDRKRRVGFGTDPFTCRDGITLRTTPGREGETVHAKKKKLSKTNAIEAVRRIMRSTGFDEEEVYGGEADQLHFASREEGDVLEGRADPGIARFAREKAKEIESAVPGAKARSYTVDEWVSIEVTLPGGAAPSAKPAKPPAETEPLPEWAQRVKEKAPKCLQPGDEIEYTNFTVGGSYEGKAIVTWDHGKSVEARTLGGERLRLERAADGSLRRFT
jgi:hypothetical protein